MRLGYPKKVSVNICGFEECLLCASQKGFRLIDFDKRRAVDKSSTYNLKLSIRKIVSFYFGSQFSDNVPSVFSNEFLAS